MKRFSAILALVIVLAMTMSIIPVSAATELTFTIENETPEVDKNGEGSFSIKFTPATNSTKVGAITLAIKFDPTLVVPEKDYFYSETLTYNVDPAREGVLLVTRSSDAGLRGNIGQLYYTAADKDGVAKFSILEITECCSVQEVDYDCNYADAAIEVTIGEGGSSEPEDPKVFGVTATDNGTNTVVKVENKGDLEGLVYAASYDANGVLVNCAPAQALADTDLTFAGITGNVKVFVWDANNAPLLDAFVTATVQ